MKGEWKTMPLADCMAAIIDYRGKTPNKTTYGVPLVTAKVIKSGRIEQPDEFIAEADFVEWMRRGMPMPGDIVMTTEAPLGEIAQLDGKKVALAQRVITLRGKSDLLDNTFLKFLMQSRAVQDELESRATGTTVLGIRQSELRKVNLTLPPLPTQRAIAHVLGTLDDLIELNRETNAILEEMARALFKSWFVDFDPVRAKLEGRPPAGMDAETAKLFPDHFQDSELGEIPRGWESASLGDVVEVFDSKRVPLSGMQREQRQGPYPYHGAASVMDYIDDYLFDGIYMLMGEDGSVTKENGTPVVQYVWGKFWVNNHAHVLRGKNGICTEHLLLYLKETNIEAFVTGAVQAKLNQGNMNRIPFLLPPIEIGEAFASEIEPLFATIRANADESRDLATLRDTLLPKLLSGELSVAEVEGRIAERMP